MSENLPIEVRKRTLRIDDQVYQIPNIVRVDWDEWSPNQRYGSKESLLRKIGIFGGIGLVAAAILGSTVHGGAAIAVLFLTVVVVVPPLKSLIGLLLTSKRYAVFIMTAGSASGVVSSTDQVVVRELFDLVVGAIENPPDDPIIHHISNIKVEGDLINQTSNSGSIVGKVSNA